jgi:hypothetical protein
MAFFSYITTSVLAQTDNDHVDLIYPVEYKETLNSDQSFPGSIFNIHNNDNKWINVTGAWRLDESGLHGGSGSEINSSTGNILLNPVIPNNFSTIQTSFRINEISPEASNYASIVYSFIDPETYYSGGIHILNNSIYIILQDVLNDTTVTYPQWPGIDTGLTWTPGSLFNLSIVKQDNSIGVALNGTSYDFHPPFPNHYPIGNMGLSYGLTKSIDFHDFLVQPDGDQHQNNSLIDEVNMNGIVVSDSQTISLEDKRLPEDSYIHLYDSTPYTIHKGHISAKIPCDDDNSTDVNVLAGSVSILNPVQLEYVSALSIPGEQCLYHADIESNQLDPITDIVVANNSTDEIDFPSGSGILVSVSEISQEQ